MESFNVNKVNQLQMNISVDLTQHLCKQDMKNHLPSCYHIQAMFKEPLRKCFPLNVHLNLVLLRSSRLWQLPSAKSVFSFLCYQVRLVYSVVHWFLVFGIIDHSKSRLFKKKQYYLLMHSSKGMAPNTSPVFGTALQQVFILTITQFPLNSIV